MSHAERSGRVLLLIPSLAACAQIVNADFDGLSRRDAASASGNAASDGADASADGEGGQCAPACGTGGGPDGAAAGAGEGGRGASGAGGAAPSGGTAGAAGSTSDAGPPAQRIEPASYDNALHFGSAVAIDGDWALVGSEERNGYPFAWFFQRVSGAWTRQQKVPTPAGLQNRGFAGVTALSGDAAAIGAPAHADAPGIVLFYERDPSQGGTWSLQDDYQASSPGRNDRFGAAIALRGATAAIGAPGENEQRGAIYVYRHDLYWQLVRKLEHTNGPPLAAFGSGIALEDDTLVACAAGEGGNGAGNAYVYTRAGDTWDFREPLPIAEAGLRGFCTSLALENGRLVIGASATSGGGSAYVYTRDANGSFASRAPQRLSPGVSPARDFGLTTAFCGGALLVGHNGVTNFGSVFVYRERDASWLQVSELQPRPPRVRDFGTPLACDGAAVLAGYPDADDQRGAAYFFSLDD